jgi:hypothetical protein
MSNRTYICVECRSARRAGAAYGLVTPLRCAGCGASLWELSHKWRIPRKSDIEGWDELKRIVNKEEPARLRYLNVPGEGPA